MPGGTYYKAEKEAGVNLHQYKMKVLKANYCSVNQYGFNTNLKPSMIGKPRERNSDSTSSTSSNKEN